MNWLTKTRLIFICLIAHIALLAFIAVNTYEPREAKPKPKQTPCAKVVS